MGMGRKHGRVGGVRVIHWQACNSEEAFNDPKGEERETNSDSPDPKNMLETHAMCKGMRYGAQDMKVIPGRRVVVTATMPVVQPSLR